MYCFIWPPESALLLFLSLFNIVQSCFLKMNEKREIVVLSAVSVIDIPLFHLVNAIDFLVYAALLLIFICVLYLQLKHVTGHII
jgi:hypothetical protein